MNLKLNPKTYRHVRKAAKTQGLTNNAFVERSVVQCLEDQRSNAHSPSAQFDWDRSEMSLRLMSLYHEAIRTRGGYLCKDLAASVSGTHLVVGNLSIKSH